MWARTTRRMEIPFNTSMEMTRSAAGDGGPILIGMAEAGGGGGDSDILYPCLIKVVVISIFQYRSNCIGDKYWTPLIFICES